jgi:uncharacterized protein (TIGR00299 family) protein
VRIAYLDCSTGISGDMTVAALIDAGVKFSTQTVMRCAFRALHLKIEHPEQHAHRHLADIVKLIDAAAALTPRQKQLARRIFEAIAQAEAKVHGTTVEKIHFHEVGAVHAIVDIVGACIGFEALGVEQFACSPLNVGGGTAKMAHGVLPVPAPATAKLLLGKPTYSNGVQKELVTPTGAAIVATLCTSFGPQPPMSVSTIGYGAGTADLEGQPNVVRIMVGEAAEKSVAGFDEEIAVIEANLDDMNPQIYGYFQEKALAAGALDVYTTPVQMKKNRPGILLTILCRPHDTPKLMDLIFTETTTFGARTYRAQRRTLPRESVNVHTQFGDVRVKISRVNGHIRHAAPEFEDCKKLAEEKHVPLHQVIDEAKRNFENM